jgi:dye decolorizing peroxidase
VTDDQTSDSGRSGLSRRRLLLGGAVAGLGAAAAIGADYALKQNAGDGVAQPQDVALSGSLDVPFYGIHQAGIATAPQANATFVALDLRDGTNRDGLRRMMTILTDDAARLTAGTPPLADSEPELATIPARLTITFGFSAGFVNRATGVTAGPSWLGPLPAFGIDRLEPEWTGGDLIIQIASEDSLTTSHATRMLLKDARSFCTVRWTQTGFRRARGSEKAGTTMRNLFGQVDGTANPVPGSDDFDQLVWSTDGWLAGGTSLVVRRIRMNLDKWDHLDRGGREKSVGRTLANGAPLTGSKEFDVPDFDAKTAIGFPVISDFSHLRRARSENTTERIFRRGYNYEHTPTGADISNSGLIFASYQTDVNRQFVPIQQRLDKLDLLNEWTTPIGSAVFAVPPGCSKGGFIGDTLLG